MEEGGTVGKVETNTTNRFSFRIRLFFKAWSAKYSMIKTVKVSLN